MVDHILFTLDDINTREEKKLEMLFDACAKCGAFLVYRDDNIKSSSDYLFKHTQKFFESDLEEKVKISIDKSSCRRGYIEPLGERIPNIFNGDIKESFEMGEDKELNECNPLEGPNQYPEGDFKIASSNYFDEIKPISRTICKTLNLISSNNVFNNNDDTMYHLRMLHYDLTRHSENSKEICGTHIDYGSITIIIDTGVNGLQIRNNQGEWDDIDIPENKMLVLLGGLAELSTGYNFRAPPHRVLHRYNPNSHRYSLVFFVTPPYKMCIDEGNKKIKVGDYLSSRINESLERRLA